MSLGFLSPSCTAGDLLASPLARALADADPQVVRDVSLEGKVELRGPIDVVELEPGEELIQFSPGRGLLLTRGDPAEVVERLREAGVLAYDATGALAGLAFAGEQVAWRLTDLDLDRLPAAGMVAKIGAILLRDEGERFRLYFPQELGHYVAEVVLDAIAGLDTGGEGLK